MLYSSMRVVTMLIENLGDIPYCQTSIITPIEHLDHQ